MLLAVSMMLSACPVSAYAETAETEPVVLETEAVTEPSETTVVTEPAETTVATEPEETTAFTEPSETVEATEPVETTEVTEPEETAASTEPPETTGQTEPAVTLPDSLTVEDHVSQDAAMAATVASGTCGEKLTWVLDENGVLTISGEGAMKEYGSSENAYPWYSYKDTVTRLVLEEGITSIGNYAFYKYYMIDGELVIPDTVKTIGECAFYQCGGIDSLSLGSGVETIKRYAFYGCDDISGSLILPESLVTLGYGAFRYCSGFTGDLTIPKNVREMGTLVFAGCSGLKGRLILSEGITEICDYAFQNTKFTGVLEIPNSVENIGNYAFDNCTGFTGLTLGRGLETIGEYAFQNCSGMKGDLVIPDSVTALGVYSFYNCTGFKGSLTLSENLLDIPHHAFYQCNFTGSLELPEMLVSIGSYAFYDCDNFTGDLVLPDSLLSIGSYAFYYCQGFNGTLTLSKNVSTIGSYAFYYCDGFTGDLEIFDSVTTISSHAFAYCGGMKGKLTLPEGLIKIEDGVFFGCDFSGDLTLPDTLTTIGKNGFDSCDSFTGDLYIPDSVTSIGGAAFYGCSGFNGKLQLSENLTAIDSSAFANCSGFTGRLTIPDSVTTLGAACFRNMTGITSITLGTGLTELCSTSSSDSPFDKCTSVTEITFLGLTVPATNAETLASLSALETVHVPAGALSGYREALASSLPAGARIVPEGAEGEFLVTDGVLQAYLGESTEVVIPAELGIEVIGPGAFQNCAEITAITIPETVISIGSYAFASCTSLQTLSIPETVTEIGDYAFWKCTALASVALPDAVTALGNSLFRGCTGLTAVSLPKNLTTIGNYAFQGCTGLTSVALPDTVTALGNYAFQKCTGLTAMVFPQGLTKIGTYAFQYCTSLTVAVLPEALTTLGNYAFQGCTGLSGKLTIPANLTTLGSSVFSRCTSLTGLDLNKVTTIGSYAFDGCSGLTGDLVIPDSVTSVGTYAFQDCSGVNGTLTISANLEKIQRGAFAGMTQLQEVVFGEKITTVGESGDSNSPFQGAENLTTLTFLGATPPSLHQNLMKELTGLETIYVASANLSAYISKYSSSLPDGVNIKAYDVDSDFQIQDGVLLAYTGEGGEIVIPDTVTKIGSSAFKENLSITKVTIPEGVTEIGSSAFYGCTALTEVSLPSTLETIGSYAFYGCSGLTGSLAIPGSVTVIGGRAFYNCTGLDGTLTFREGLQTIGDLAFYGCSGLTGTLTIPDSVTSIGQGCFEFLYEITAVTLGSGLKTLGSTPFYGCSALTALTFRGETVPTVSSLFSKMDALTTIYVPGGSFEAYSTLLSSNLPDQVRLLAADATEDLYIRDNVLVSYLGDGGHVVIPEGVTAIGASAFRNCTGLTSVSIPDTVTTIGQYAFYKAAGLTALEFGTGIKKIESNAFNNCDAVTEIIFKGATAPTISSTGNLSTMNGITAVYVLAASYESYLKVLKSAMGSVKFRLLTLEGQEEFLINNGVLVGYTGLAEEVVIPDGVTAIDDYAFANCAAITKVTMPDTVKTIGSRAFYKCSAISEITLPDSVQTVGSYAFSNCTGLQQVTLSENLTAIGNYAFSNCSALTGTLRIPDSVQTIGNYAFYQDKALTGLELGSGLTAIGNNAFYNCTGMRGDLILPDSLTSLGEAAFRSCGFNGSLVLSEGLTSIPRQVFYGCKFVGALVIPNGVETILAEAFRGLSKITSITVGSSVTSMDEYSASYQNQFYGCSNVTEITFLSAKVPSYAAVNLAELKKLETIYVPADAYDTYATTFASYLGSHDTVALSTNFLNARVGDLRVKQLYGGSVVLGWNPHISEEVVGYTVFRDGAAVGTSEACSFTDRNLTLGKTYVYTVQGYTAEGETTAAAEISVTTRTPKAYDIKTANGTTKVNENSNTLRGYVSHTYSMAPLGDDQNTGTFYYEQDGQRVLMGQAVKYEDLSSSTTFVYTLDWDMSGLEEGDYTVVFCAADPDGTVSEYSKTITIDRSVPEKIAAVMAVDDVSRINVNWAIAAEVDTNIYRIYRRAGSDEKFQLIAQINDRNTLTYADTNVRTDRVYYYYVVGVNELGQEGEPSETVGATLMGDEAEPVVTRLSPSNGSWISGKKKIYLSAEDNVQVTRAELHYSVDAGETWTMLAELRPGKWWAELDTLSLEEGVIRVKGIAWDAAGNASRELIYDYAIDNTGPQKVTGLSYSSTNVTATLRWNNVSDKDIHYFRVEKKLETGLYEMVTDVTGTLGVNLYGLTPGTEYVYRVVGYDLRGNRGIPSDDLTVVTKNDYTPPVITDLQPAPGYYSGAILVKAMAYDEHSVAAVTLQTSTDRISWTDVYTEEYTDSARNRTVRYSLALDAYREGNLYVRAVARDSGGNESDIGVDAPFVQYIVDRTAPAAPENVAAEGGCGFVEISWKQGGEQDLDTYSVYRGDSLNGTYERIASGLRTVNYYDRSVSEGVTYYYKVTVQDLAGNESGFSQTVFAAGKPDTEKPVIVAVSPADGSRIGPGNCQIGVTATDNSTLASIKIQYSAGTDGYTTLCELKNLVSYGDYAAAKLPIKDFADGQTIRVRVSAKDKAGNESEAFLAAYTVDTTAPGVLSASAVFDTDHVRVSWTGKNEPDLSGYRIYRGESGTYTLIRFCDAVAGTQAYSFRDTGISTGSNLYTYKIEAVDRCGNASAVITERVELPDRQFPRAVISCDNTMQNGVEYIIDGTGSSDNTEITSYFFDFGDGTTGTEPSAVHKYTQTGSYTITLTVTDTEGNQTTASKTVTVVDRALIGTVKVLVVDEYGTAVPGASVYLDLGEEAQAIKKTDNRGYAVFTAQVGRHTLGCVIPDNQWLPAKKDVVVTAGAETDVTMTLVHQPLIQGEFEVNRMTFAEIEAAGIDVKDPANQHIVRVNVSLTYGESQKIDTSFLFNMTTKESSDNNIFLDTDKDGTADREFVPVILGGGEDEEQVAVAYLDLPVGTSFLKEFFDVSLHIINNASSDFSMTGNVVTLNVPEGMSIVDAAGKEDHALVKIPEIPGQTTKTVSWILRGDQEGTYNLTANYSGILSAFEEPIYATFVAKEPLKVYGLSAVKLIAEINSTITNDAFHFNLGLENVSGIDVNMPSVEILENVLNTYLTKQPVKENTDAEEEPEEETPEVWAPQVRHLNTIVQDASGNRQHIGTETEVTTLRPGERLTKQYAVYNAVGFNNVMHLRSAIAEIAEASGLKVEIIETDMDLYNTDNAADKLSALSGDKKALYDYILRNDQFFYVMESVHRDQTILDSIAAGSFGSARDHMNIGAYTEEARAITRKMVAQLLLDESMQEAIADRAGSRYTEVAAAGIKSVSRFLTEAEQEEAGTALAAFAQQPDALGKLGAVLKDEGYSGYIGYLLDQLKNAGVADEALALIRQHSESEDMAADMEAALQAACAQTGAVLEKVGDLLDRWYDSGMLFRDMIAVSAVYEESAVLLEMLETNLDPGSAAVQEIRAIRSSLDTVRDGQTASFLEQMGSTADPTPDQVKKYLDASFGAGTGAGYTLAKLIFGEAYDALTWNGFSDGRHVLQLNTELSFALTDAVRYHGLNAESEEQAVYTLKALKYLIRMRMLGEQNYVNYCAAMDAAAQAEAVAWINRNMGTSYTDLQEYAADILALLSEYRDTIFASYYTRLDIPEAPSVTINYLTSATNEVFSAAYEYRFEGTRWHTCAGTAIPIQPGTVPKSLQVRLKETDSSLAGNAAKIVIPAMPRIFGEISVSRSGANCGITGLEAGAYRYAFTNDHSLETLSGSFAAAEGQTVTIPVTGDWVYLAIRKEATETEFASQIRYLAVETISAGISGTCGQDLTWILDDQGTLTISGTGGMEDYKNSTLTPWYAYAEQIYRVVIAPGATHVGTSAFSGCSNLTSIELPDGIVSIGGAAFSGCGSLADIVLPESVTGIGNRAFEECTSLTDITVPKNVTELGNYVFYGCSGLTGVTLPKGITKIGVMLFCDCSSLTDITIPDSVTMIDRSAFSGCSGLTSIEIPERVTAIGQGAFADCTGLTGITIPDQVTSIGQSAFTGCTGLTEITVPASVTDIGDMAFWQCKSLRSVTFRGDMPLIAGNVFNGVTAAVYYPAGNATWVTDDLVNGAGNLTLIPYSTVANRIALNSAELDGQTSLWIDGVEYAVQTSGSSCFVDLPHDGAETMTAYTFHEGDASDLHTQYPVSMKVWSLENEDGFYTAVRQEAFDDILQYSGSSIRLTGKQGIRMITAIDQAKKKALVSSGLAGYTLKEYGTVVAWSGQLEGGNPLVLGRSYAMSNYAYRKGVADPVFGYEDGRMQYTNVLVGFSTEQCQHDIAMRPYMILRDDSGDEITIYGGVVHRSIGYIAWQNRNVFQPGTEAYAYVWDIIHSVYGDAYDEDYKA